MSPNKNYQTGRAFEYAYAKHLRTLAYDVSRTAGSHGAFDLWAVGRSGHVIAIQCKVVTTEAEAYRLMEKFERNRPYPDAKFQQRIAVKVKGTSDILERTL